MGMRKRVVSTYSRLWAPGWSLVLRARGANVPSHWWIYPQTEIKDRDAGWCFPRFSWALPVAVAQLSVGTAAGCGLQLWACSPFSAGLLGPSKTTALGWPSATDSRKTSGHASKILSSNHWLPANPTTEIPIHLSKQLNCIYLYSSFQNLWSATIYLQITSGHWFVQLTWSYFLHILYCKLHVVMLWPLPREFGFFFPNFFWTQIFATTY